MSTLIALRDISKAFGIRSLFTGISLAISDKERIGLVGANGSGKSTLLKILAGLEKPDSGERTPRQGLRMAYVPQADSFPAGSTAEQVVAQALTAQGTAHGAASEAEVHTRVAMVLSRLGFADPGQAVESLSGGWRKRLALARALATEPDLLLLDEPTNHLDLNSILWLEGWLRAAPLAFVVVSHDRYFLENVASRTIELARSYPEGFLSVAGPYSALLEKREEFLATQAGYEQTLANKARREIEWLRRGPKARATKAKARIDAAGQLQQELAATRERNRSAGRASIDFSGTARQTRRLLVAEGLSKGFGERTFFSDLEIVLSPGVRLGLVGGNGSGKTTLLKTLAGELRPDAGSVKRAPALEVVTFDQKREQLDKDMLLRRAFAPDSDSVFYRDRPIHVVSWAKRFLFRPEQLDLPVGLLSGGEQARLLIARLMLRPADVLLLDEPTNDLDIPTLETLEESLLDFPGAVVLITHDRLLLDRVSTVLLGLDGHGGAEVYADYAQWEADYQEREKARKAAEKAAGKAPAKALEDQKSKAQPKKKLSYKEQKEWDGMEAAIAEAEERLAGCQKALEDPAVASDAAQLQARLASQEAAQAEVDGLYARWAELEEKLAE